MPTCSADRKDFHLLIGQPATAMSCLPGANILYLKTEEKLRVNIHHSVEATELLKSMHLLKSFNSLA